MENPGEPSIPARHESPDEGLSPPADYHELGSHGAGFFEYHEEKRMQSVSVIFK
ncbi:hypothetical protein RSAG8_04963, partial [Rhizoctonia solani AG-8 WAC10335]